MIDPEVVVNSCIICCSRTFVSLGYDFCREDTPRPMELTDLPANHCQSVLNSVCDPLVTTS